MFYIFALNDNVYKMPATKIEKTKWLKLGIERFSTQGIQGINIEQIAKKLDCNKSSFYWHFKTKEAFLNEIIQYWFDNSTTPVYLKISEDLNPNERFDKFITLSFKDKSRKDLMFYLRKSSTSNTKLKELLDKLTNTRLTYVSSLIKDLGYTQNEAKIKAEILLNFYIGWYEINKDKVSNNNQNIIHGKNLIRDFIKF